MKVELMSEESDDEFITFKHWWNDKHMQVHVYELFYINSIEDWHILRNKDWLKV